MTREDFKKLTQSNKPVFIDFYADWCEPCKMLDNILEEIKPQLTGKVNVVKIDLDTHPDLQKEFAIKSVPTLMIFKNGELMWRMSGFMMGDELVKKMIEFV
jgi:thioredoxin 1